MCLYLVHHNWYHSDRQPNSNSPSSSLMKQTSGTTIEQSCSQRCYWQEQSFCIDYLYFCRVVDVTLLRSTHHDAHLPDTCLNTHSFSLAGSPAASEPSPALCRARTFIAEATRSVVSQNLTLLYCWSWCVVPANYIWCGQPATWQETQSSCWYLVWA